MNRMLDLLYAWHVWAAFDELNCNCHDVYRGYMGRAEFGSSLFRDDLAILLLLIAAAEGFSL